jgi:hypothetical protein
MYCKGRAEDIIFFMSENDVMKTNIVLEVNLHAFLTSTSDRDEWTTLPSGRLIPEKEPALSIGWKTGWAVGPVKT